MSTVEEFRPPSHLLNKGQYARVMREARISADASKAERIAALWATARRLYPSLVGAK